MKRPHLSYICLLIALCSLTGCAETILIQRDSGEHYTVSGNKLGNKKIKYSVSFHPDGKLKTEAYEYERDIASPIGQVGNAIAEAIGAAGNKL